MSMPAFMAPKTPARSFSAVFGLAARGGAAAATPLDGFPLQSQALDNWCWAAVAAGVDAVLGAQQSQCTIAGRYGGATAHPEVAGKLQPPICPPNGNNDTIGYLNEVLDCLGLSREPFRAIANGAVVETNARADLASKRPTPIRIPWKGGGGTSSRSLARRLKVCSSTILPSPRLRSTTSSLSPQQTYLRGI